MANPTRIPFQYRSSSNALQKAVGQAIIDGGLLVWDGVNRKPDHYPYVKIGEELTSERVPSKDSTGKYHNLTLHIWSDLTSTIETKAVADYLIDILVWSEIQLDDGFCVMEQKLDHVKYIEADNSTNNNQRAFLFLDFLVSDSLKAPI